MPPGSMLCSLSLAANAVAAFDAISKIDAPSRQAPPREHHTGGAIDGTARGLAAFAVSDPGDGPPSRAAHASARSMPCDAAGALAIRSGEQHGLNVIVVLISSPSTDLAGRCRRGARYSASAFRCGKTCPSKVMGRRREKGATARSTSPSYRESSVINVDLVFPTSGAKCLASAARFGNCWPW